MDKVLVESVLRQEQGLAYDLLKTLIGIDFVKPVLYVGEEHRSKFVSISSLKDVAGYPLIQMVYNDEINGILIPGHLLGAEEDMLSKRAKLHRIFCFLHENIHALSTQINPSLKEENVVRLMDEQTDSNQEKGYVFCVFCEGLAEYLAIRSCLASNSPTLKSFGQERHREHRNFMDKWVASKEFSSMAKIYKIDPSLWQQVLVRYFTDNLGGLIYYQYEVGYWFMRKIQVEFRNLKTLILAPPSQIAHLVYPERYRKEKGGSIK